MCVLVLYSCGHGTKRLRKYPLHFHSKVLESTPPKPIYLLQINSKCFI